MKKIPVIGFSLMILSNDWYRLLRKILQARILWGLYWVSAYIFLVALQEV